jgi:hypothetical protein
MFNHTVTDHFHDRLQFVSETYHHALSKKKDFAGLDQNKEKLLPIDALGIVMRNHGVDFGEDSAFGGLCIRFSVTPPSN